MAQVLRESERLAAIRRRSAAAHEAADPADVERAPHPLVTLGGQVGNAQVARMLAQREGEEEEEVAAKHDPIQREGEEEEEVDAKHEPIQREGEEEEEVAAKHDPIQREGEEEEEVAAKLDAVQREGEEEQEVAAKPEVGLEGGPISAELSGRINA